MLACSRSRERRLVPREVAQLVVANGGGRPEERFGGDAGQLGEDLVGERRVGDRLAVVVQRDRALLAGERLLEGAGRDPALLLFLLELEADPGARIRAGVPRTQAVEIGRPRS